MKRFHSIIYSLSFILYFLFQPAAPAVAQPLMRDVFAAMPDSVLPMVTKNNRLDCIDFIENNMEAKVRNKLDEYVTLEALTTDYARFRTSAVSLMELKLLHMSDSTVVLCVVTTAQMGEPDSAQRLEDSNICFYNTDWSALVAASDSIGTTAYVPMSFPASAYVNELVDAGDSDVAQAIRSLEDYHPVRMSLASDAPTLTLTLQTAQLSKEERAALAGRLHEVILHWDGQHFVR